ncbi:MAG TPA: ComEC/Rec2 family competence protein [Flavobacterium sp.]|jgi:competence protein ComEC
MDILQFPLARITLCFITGIATAKFFQVPLMIVAGLLCCSIALLLFYYQRNRKLLIQNAGFGLIAFALSFLVGITTVNVHDDRHQKNHYVHLLVPNPQQLEVVLRERIKATATNHRYFAIVRKIDDHAARGKLLVNIKKTLFNKELPVGSVLLINSRISTHKPPSNPHQFDYGKYLMNKSVYAQLYAGREDIVISANSEKDIWYYSDLLRRRILTNVRKSNFQERELHVLAALILGQQQDIDPEIIKNYQYAGAVHILSVSGLHVGFILLFINLVLKYVPNSKWSSYVKLFTALLCLWSFAVIAGLSPSVVRSVTMFSFVAIGMHLRRSTNIFHTLLVSILLILLVQPSFLFDVGFQLSYVALFFILWLQPLLHRIWQPKHKITNYFWEILTVSFAAQLGTLPLSLYYFHQFPGLFFISNLIIIPFLTIIMALGVLVVVVAAFNYAPSFLSDPLEYCISVLNRIIAYIAGFDDFVVKDIPFNSPMMILLYLLLIATVLWVRKPTVNKAMAALSLVSMLQIIMLITRWESIYKRELLVLDVRKSTTIVDRKGQNAVLYGKQWDSSKRILQAYCTSNFMAFSAEKQLPNVIWFQHKKIMIIDSFGVYPKKANPDILILIQSPKINLERLLSEYKPGVIVADGSNYRTYVSLWRKTCLRKNISFHSTADEGYFLLK